jgi:NAD(P)-dependent dehydrogenase (short-subunit alcohol dehydrogenase family)
MAAMARMFAREGAKLVIADVLEHEGRQVADAIGASARFEPLDATKEEGWAAELCARHLPPAQFSPGVLFSAYRIVCDYGRIGQPSIFAPGPCGFFPRVASEPSGR